MKRPMGITILALLLLVNGAALAVQAGALYSNQNIGATFGNAYLQRVLPSTRLDAAGIMFFAGIAAIFSLAIGTGLLLLVDMARWGLIVATGLPLGRQMIGVAIVLVTKPGALTQLGDAFWFQTMAFGGIVWYLFQPQVQCAFTGRGEFYDPYGDEEHDPVDKWS